MPPTFRNSNGRTGPRRGYLLFEVTFALPKYPEWAIVGRIHHRSGFFGALAANGSNVVAVGIKYRF